jgi:acetyl esterase/lipase
MQIWKMVSSAKNPSRHYAAIVRALAQKVKHVPQSRMGKKRMTFIVALAAFTLLIGWQSRWSKPGMLDLADRMYGPGPHVGRSLNIAYGPLERQTLDIWTPEGAGPFPVIIFFHGGGWNAGERQVYGFAGRALAEKGFVAVIPDYRLAPQHRFPAFIEDGAAATAWVRKHIGTNQGDPDRITISGHSAGAHIAAMLTLDQQWLNKAGAGENAIKAFVGLSGPYDFLPFTTDSAKQAFAGTPYPEVTQPISFVRPDAPPALLLTGGKDTTVKSRNSHALAKALTQQKAMAQVVDYTELDHSDTVMALARPFRGKAPILQDLTDFARKEGIARADPAAIAPAP